MRKRDFKFLSKQKLQTTVNADLNKDFYLDSASKRDNISLLLEAKEAWDSLKDFRLSGQRNGRYTFGDQWGDRVKDPNSTQGGYITESELIMRQGKVPLKNNIIRKLVKSVLGQYRRNETEPVCSVRDRDEQKLGEMMSIAIQYVYQLNRLKQIDAYSFQDFLIYATCCQKIRYKSIPNKQITDVFVEEVCLDRLFFNSDMEDRRGLDCRLIGEIHDMTPTQLIATFAKSPQQAQELRDLYKYVSEEEIKTSYRGMNSYKLDSLDFMISNTPGKCRVIELWRKESKQRLRAHDILKGEELILELSDEKRIKLENQNRLNEASKHGIPSEEVALIEYEWFVDEYWYCRFLSPYGDVLWEGETPYEHGQHPYVFSLYSFHRGEVHSFVEDIIDQQRYVNRLITLWDFIIGASAKGVLMFPKEAIPEGTTEEEIMERWVEYNGVIFTEGFKQGQTMKPEQISASSVPAGMIDLLNIQFRLLEDISGVSSAMQGKDVPSGTAASLYKQQVEQSSVNLVDLLDSFKDFKEERDYKILNTIQQYYNTPRYINIGGKTYSEESKYYNPQKIATSQFDLTIGGSSTSANYVDAMNDMLLSLFNQKAINVRQLLEVGNFPFSEKLIQSLDSMEEAAKQGQSVQMDPALAQQMQQGAHPMIQQALQR